MCLQLGHGYMLQRDRVVHIGGDYNTAMAIVLRGGEKGPNIREYRVIDLKHVGCGLEIRNRVVTKRRGKDECVVAACALRVKYLPISHAEPRKGESAILIKPKIANYLGLKAEKSYLYTSYACEDDWSFDVVPVPGSKDKFHYGMIPPAFFNVVTEPFRQYLAQRLDFNHKR